MNNQENGAIFSPCRCYRYVLWRVWDTAKPQAMFIGLNPSTADQNTDDNTIRKVRAITANWGCGGFYMVNLFSLVTPYPAELFECADPIQDNDHYLKMAADLSDRVVFAWGNFKVAGRDEVMKKMFPRAYCLHINKNGSPKHPLYMKNDALPFKYR